MKKHYLLLIALFVPMMMIGQVDVTLNVNMSYQIELGEFDPADSNLDVAGTFNDWSGTPLSDPDNDSIFSVTIDSLNVGDTIEFKFRMNGAWDGTEEFANGGDNRSYIVLASGNDVTYWYNDNDGTSISIIADTPEFDLYPNPAQDVINVNTEFNVKSIEVINVCGVAVLVNDVNNSTNAVQLNVSELTEGIYFVRISGNNSSATKRLIIE